MNVCLLGILCLVPISFVGLEVALLVSDLLKE